ncbi:LuxR C-terminal-related transcriptional regulator [Streptosporangium sp. NPDC006007]|uniref:helix-turn-helix transcriptional regulator n=1 Tax=Streptosporangium sp. NPDC006007 TaxID=3154575 RepID=UPI0033BD20A0
MDAIRSRIERLALRAEIEIASLMTAVPRDPAVIDSAITLDRRVRERGVTIRSVGMDRLRGDPAALTYARRLVDIGAEVRVAPTLPVRMLIYDRQVALVPFDPANSAAGAVQVTGKGAVAAILALFEQVWASALPIDSIPAKDDAGLSPQERELLRLLAEGLTDARAGRHLGISPRTVRRTVAGMMSRLGARSRFEAGLRAVERGWI